MNRSKVIDGELLRLKNEIQQYAIDYGLDFPEVIFEVCDYDTVNILAAQGGFPNRYPHWRFGMEYDQLYKGYAFGLQKIYEMVINTDPCYAYLLSVNHMVDQKVVMAHVYAHADFFKNNQWFSNTNRAMMDVMANHGTKIRRYMDRYGVEAVEDFIDKVLSLENLMDVGVLFKEDRPNKKTRDQRSKASGKISDKDSVGDNNEDDWDSSDLDDGRSPALRSFMRSKLRQADTDKEDKEKAEGKGKDKKTQEQLERNKNISSRDVMMYLMANAPLEEWEADVIGILREECYYFLPQRLTKIMNEGWASYWHSKIMTQKALKSSEIIDFADHHAGVMQMSRKRINPYKIGIELFKDIEFRWNTGRFGKEYEDCTDMSLKEKWDKNLGQGRDKIFEVRKSHNDITFIDEYFTREFCERQQLFTYKYNPSTNRNEIDSREFMEVKAKLLAQLTNFGSPVIEVETGNFNNRSELLLRHVHYGIDLDLAMARDTLANIHYIWKRPVNLATIYDGKEMIYVFDGKEMRPIT